MAERKKPAPQSKIKDYIKQPSVEVKKIDQERERKKKMREMEMQKAAEKDEERKKKEKEREAQRRKMREDIKMKRVRG